MFRAPAATAARMPSSWFPRGSGSTANRPRGLYFAARPHLLAARIQAVTQLRGPVTNPPRVPVRVRKSVSSGRPFLRSPRPPYPVFGCFRRHTAIAVLFVAACAEAEPQPGRRLELSTVEPVLSWETGERIRLRDGEELEADILRSGPGALPAIVEITPYGRGPEDLNFRGEAEYWQRHGYAFVIVDARGTGDSGGEFEFFRNSGADGYDVVEWIAEQPWSNGRVAMRGSSYTGTNQLYTASAAPPHLDCITPSATAGPNPIDDVPYLNGAFHTQWALNWPTQIAGARISAPGAIDWVRLLAHGSVATLDEALYGQPLPLYRVFLDRGPTDPYWDPVVFTEADYAAIEIPSLAFTGWFDGTLTGTLDQFVRMQSLSPVAARQFLVVGPWEHLTAPDGGLDFLNSYEPVTRVGNVELPPDAFIPGLELTREFYDWCLKGQGDFDRSRVRFYLTGSHEWVELDEWPPPTMPQHWYLASEGNANGLAGRGILSRDQPTEARRDTYLYDPARPTWTVIQQDGRWRPVTALPSDLSPLIDRSDVLVFRSEPFDGPITVVGEIRLELYATSTAPNTDFVAFVEDIAPDGAATKLGARPGGFARVGPGDAPDGERLPSLEDPTNLVIPVATVGHTFLSGHRIRVSITSSAYPAVYPHPNRGDWKTGSPRTATQTVYHDPTMPSRLVLPVFKR